MARGRATSPVDERTIEGRLRAARLASPYTAQELAEAMGLASAQSLYDYETPGKSGSPSPAALGVFSRRTGRSLKWLVYGEKDDAEDTPFIALMRAFDEDLDPAGRYVVEKTAAAEVEQAKKRAAEALSVEEEELLRRFRAASQTGKRLILAAAEPDTAPPQRQQQERPARQSGQGRRPGRSA